MLTVDYDRLVKHPREELAALLRFCRLPWDERCLAFHETGGAVATPSAWQVRQPLYTRSSGRWQHYAEQLQPLRDALAPWLEGAAAGSGQPIGAGRTT